MDQPPSEGPAHETVPDTGRLTVSAGPVDADAPVPDPDPALPSEVGEAPVEREVAAGSSPRRRRPTGFRVAVALAVVVAVAAAVMGVLATRGGEDTDLERVRETSGRFGAALVTYDYHDPSAHRDAVLKFATGSFREEYQDAFDQGLAQVITEVKAVSTGYVKDVYVSAIDEGRAQAIVVVDIEHDGTSGKNTLYDVYFRLTLVKVDGTWKIDQVTDLNFDTGSGAGASAGAPTPEGDPTTSTTALTSTSVP